MARWAIPCTIIEHNRLAIVEADTKAEALKVFRDFGWDELGSTDHYTVKKTGKIVPWNEPPTRRSHHDD